MCRECWHDFSCHKCVLSKRLKQQSQRRSTGRAARTIVRSESRTTTTRCERNTIRFTVAADGSWHFSLPIAMAAD
jgi:hypothetical protein